MAGTPLRNLQLFEKLCGKEFSTIVLATTMWEEVEPELGEMRERELQNIYWKSMVDRGSSVKRFLQTPASAFEVLRPILCQSNEHQSLRLQEEITNLGLKLQETAAGRMLAVQLDEMLPKQQKILTRIRNHLMDPTLPPEQLATLQREYQMVSAQLQNVAVGSVYSRSCMAYQVIIIIFQRFSVQERETTTKQISPVVGQYQQG